MYYLIMNNPSVASLIEPGMKYFLGSTLRECRLFKYAHYNVIFNSIMTLLFLLVIGSLLFYCYKGKLTPAEIALKNRQKQEYIISKLQQLALYKKKQTQSQSLITDLPSWDPL